MIMLFKMFTFDFETANWAFFLGLVKQIFIAIDTVFILDAVFFITAFTHNWSGGSLLYLFWNLYQGCFTHLTMSNKFWIFKSTAWTVVFPWLFNNFWFFLFGHTVWTGKNIFSNLLMTVFTYPSTIVHVYKYYELVLLPYKRIYSAIYHFWLQYLLDSLNKPYSKTS